MAAAGQQIGELGENEVVEGMVRMAVSEGMAERSTELSAAGERLAERGADQVAVAAIAGQVARGLVDQGVAEVAAGAADLGAAAATESFAEALEEKAK